MDYLKHIDKTINRLIAIQKNLRLVIDKEPILFYRRFNAYNTTHYSSKEKTYNLWVVVLDDSRKTRISTMSNRGYHTFVKTKFDQYIISTTNHKEMLLSPDKDIRNMAQDLLTGLVNQCNKD